MYKKLITATGIMLLAAATLPADFSYQQTSTITGGAMASLMKVAGVFSKQAREPIRTTVAVKGNRMVNQSPTSSTIIDLDSQTITTVDFQKKTYSVMTFDDMRQLMASLSKGAKQDGAASPQFKVSADNTGKTRQISGFHTKELILKMEMLSADSTTDQKGGLLVTTDMWIAPSVPGYDEIRNFQKRMAEKINWAPGGSMFMNNPDAAKGMAEVYKEIGKLDGMPVFETVSMGASGMPAGQGAADQTAQTNGGATTGSTGEKAGDTATNQTGSRVGSALGGSLGGALGRFGGFGRKKQQQQDQTTTQQSSTTPAASSQPTNANAPATGSLIDMQVEMSDFSSAAVADSQFAIPSGFKKVDSDKKRIR